MSKVTAEPEGKITLRMQGGSSLVEVHITSEDGVLAEVTSLLTCSPQVSITPAPSSSGACFFFRPRISLHHFGLHPGMGPRGELILAPALPGDVNIVHLPGGVEWLLQRHCFLACDAGVCIRSIYPRSPKSIAVVSATGTGRLVLSSYASSIRHDLRAGEAKKVESGFLAAWTASCTCRAGEEVWGAGGEVVVVHGPGTLFLQTRSLKRLEL